MSTFKCGLRRFDGHGSSSYRQVDTAATREMESAFERLRRSREQQDAGCFAVQQPVAKLSTVLKQVDVVAVEQKDTKNCYSLSDAK